MSLAINELNSLILTPNASLAQQLRRKRLLQENRRTAPAANIHVLPSWLTHSITPELPIASDLQLRFIWEQVIHAQKESNQELQQLNPGYLAGQALAAWRSLKHWQIGQDELARAETGQLLSLKKWVVEFEKQLAKKQLSTIELEVIKQLDTAPQNQAPLVQTYAFIDPLAPLWQEWLDHQFEQVEELRYFGNESSDKQPRLCTLDSSDQEIETALSWARSVYESDPEASIAIIDVSLKDHLKPTKRRANQAFSSSVNNNQMHNQIPARFSREQPLTSLGCVQTALKLLSLNKSQINLADARYIIHSPLWGGLSYVDNSPASQQQYIDRAHWDIDLCAVQKAEVSTADFLGLIGSNDDSGSVLSKLAGIFVDRHRNKFLSPLDWCNLFQKQLKQLGCTEHFSNPEWQGWIDALSDFAQLGSVSGDISISEALQQMEYCCSSYEPKISSSAPGVTFMDTVEAAADYSHIWVLGMDNLNWPGAPKLNPLLPASLQIQRQMPHSQPQQEVELIQKLIERLLIAADQVVFSYCRFNGDMEQSACAFVAEFEALSISTSLQNDSRQANAEFEWLDCSSAPMVPEDQREVRGGASLLRTMASSPFDAFSQWRLGAYELETPKVGLSALDRGNLVHNVLERVWNQLGDSKALAQLDKAATKALCSEASEQELKRFQAKNGWLKQSYAKLEAARLTELASDWLEFERGRPGFKIELTEENLTANIAGLTFKMRLDRLDRLEDGKLMLIDYKTGQSLSRNFWLEMPPVEPQLPLYALTLEHAPDALCFAKVRADKMELIGIASESFNNINGVIAQENWADLMAGWKESLEALARDYINGDTRVFETLTGFGQQDSFAPLHRMAEYEALLEYKKHSNKGMQ